MSLNDFLERTAVPIHQNLLMGSAAEAIQVERAELVIAVCEACGFVLNRAFDTSKMLYGEDYDNNRTHSAAYERYVDDLVRDLVVERGVRGARIVEVGCGDGYFLEKLVAADAGNRGDGFDPSYRGPVSAVGGRVRYHQSYYESDEARHVAEPADVVISRHVIEHLAAPMEHLAEVRQTLAPNARVFVETPCVEWILRNTVFWDFFYEHCSYFSARSLSGALAASGFRAVDVGHIFDEQYLWIEACIAEDTGAKDTHGSSDADGIITLSHHFTRQQNALIRHWHETIDCASTKGPLALWGAAAKGATFASLMDPNRERFACVVDVNEHKQGRFLPGTGHPIVSPNELGARGIRSAILMNPIYEDEIRRSLAQDGLDVELLT